MPAGIRRPPDGIADVTARCLVAPLLPETAPICYPGRGAMEGGTMGQAETTMVADAIHNPSEPRHFMRIKPVERRVVIWRDGEMLAETSEAVRVLEVGKDLYDPVLYLPPADVTPRLRRNDDTTHCPLKGDAVYFDLLDAAGEVRVPGIAWSYPEPIGPTAELAGRVAFYAKHVTIEDRPL